MSLKRIRSYQASHSKPLGISTMNTGNRQTNCFSCNLCQVPVRILGCNVCNWARGQPTIVSSVNVKRMGTSSIWIKWSSTFQVDYRWEVQLWVRSQFIWKLQPFIVEHLLNGRQSIEWYASLPELCMCRDVCSLCQQPNKAHKMCHDTTCNSSIFTVYIYVLNPLRLVAFHRWIIQHDILFLFTKDKNLSICKIETDRRHSNREGL